jgi:putative oxidoreductase
MANILDLLGRILITALFLLSGVFKISNYDGSVDWMESFGIPEILIIPAIILEVIGPILIIIGYKARIAAGCLSLFCIVTAIIFHNEFSDQMQFTSFLKNIALAGGFLFIVVNDTKDFSIEKKFSK